MGEFNYTEVGEPRTLRNRTVRNHNSVLNRVGFHRVVVDEVQYMDNGGKAQEVIRRIHAEHHWAVSATPLKNGVASLTSLLSFVAPKYVTADPWNSLVADFNAGLPGATDALIEFVKPAILRRRKSTIELPPQRSVSVAVDLTAAETAIHGLWIANNILQHGFKTEHIGSDVREWCEFSETEMLSMARSSLLDPDISIKLAETQRRQGAAQTSHRRHMTLMQLGGGGIVGGYAQNNVKIVGSLRKLGTSGGPPRLQQLLGPIEGDLKQLVKPFSTAVQASLEVLSDDSFAQICDMERDVCLADGVQLVGMHSAACAPLFEQAMQCADSMVTDRRGCSCSICLRDIVDGDLIDVSCVNGHTHHKACIAPWYEQSGNCPQCRIALRAPVTQTASDVPTQAELAATRPARLAAERTEREKLLVSPVHDVVKNVSLLRSLVQGQAAGGAPSCSSKVAALLSMLQGTHATVRVAAGEKVIVFSMIDDALVMIKRHLLACNPPVSCRVLNKDRSAVSDFRADASVQVLLIKATLSGTGTGAAGLDLPVATKVVLMDEMPHDLKAQCADRIHRIGQTRETTVVQISASGSIDGPLGDLYRDLGSTARGATLGVMALKNVFQRTHKQTTTALRELAGVNAPEDDTLLHAIVEVEDEAMGLDAENDHEVGVEGANVAVAEDADVAVAEEQVVGAMAEQDEAAAEIEPDVEEAAADEPDRPGGPVVEVAVLDGAIGENEDDEEEEEDEDEEPPAKRMRSNPVLDWTKEEVAAFAHDLGLSEAICAALEENLVDGKMLVGRSPLTDDELISEIGLKPLQVRRLRVELDEVA